MNLRIILGCVLTGLLSFTLSAQGHYAYSYYLWSSTNYHQNYKYQYNNVDSYALANHISGFKETTIEYRKWGLTRIGDQTYLFDKNGRCETLISTMDTGYKCTIDHIMKRSFNANGMMIDNSYQNSGGARVYQVFEYNDSNKLVLATSFNRKSKISRQILIGYNESGREESVVYKRNKGKKLHSYNYYYYPNGKLKQSVLFDKKGKLIRVTDYSCDETGQTIKKIRDTARICTVRSYMPDGSVVAVTQYFDFFGKAVKIVEVRDSNDLLLKYEYYKGLKEKLYNSDVYNYMNAKLVKYEHTGYNSSGKQISSFIRLYDANGRIIKEEAKYRSKRSKTVLIGKEYIYHENGMVKGKKEYRNGKLVSETNMNYSFY